VHRIAVLLLLAASCGRIGFDESARSLGDGATAADSPTGVDSGSGDARPPCTSFTPWSAPVRLDSLASNVTDWGPTLSADGLELIFASNRGSDTNFALYDSTRASTSDDWPAPTLISEIPGGGQDPSLSLDRKTLYWGSSVGVSSATRATLTSPWTNQQQALAFGTGYGGNGGPDISRDQLTLMFTATQVSDNLWHEYTVTRGSTGAEFGSGTLAPGVANALGDSYGSLRGDGLEITYSTQDAGPIGGADLYSATRPTTADAFGSATLTSVLDSSSDEGDPDLSDDGYTITFASSRMFQTGFDLYQSTRTCAP
jgi:Tol biopolymer transport system component